MTGRLLAIRLADLRHRIALLPGIDDVTLDYARAYLRGRARASHWVRIQESLRCWDLDAVDRRKLATVLHAVTRDD